MVCHSPLSVTMGIDWSTKQFFWLIKLILQKDYIIDVKTVSKAEKRRCVCLSPDYWRTHLFIVVTYGGICDVVFTFELSLQ